MICLTYRDLPSEKTVKQGFTIQEVDADSQILRQGVILGAFDMPAIYVKHLRFEVDNKPTLIICLTEKELKPEKYVDIYIQAKEFLGNLSQP